MPNQIVQVDENMLETRLDRLVSERPTRSPARPDTSGPGNERRTGQAITSGT